MVVHYPEPDFMTAFATHRSINMSLVSVISLCCLLADNSFWLPFSEDCSAVCLEAKQVLTEFFSFDTLSEVCRRLVSQYFLLTTDDLTAWEADPEEFC